MVDVEVGDICISFENLALVGVRDVFWLPNCGIVEVVGDIEIEVNCG